MSKIPESDGGAAVLSTAAFRLTLLGGLGAFGGEGPPVTLPTQKSRLLMAYLATPLGHMHARGKLAGLLWQDRDEEQARGSLRNALSAIRQAFGTAAVVGDHDVIGLNAAAFSSDVMKLEALSKAGAPGITGTDAASLTGVFLDGVDATGTGRDEWLAFERTRCRNLAQRLLQGVAEHLSTAHENGDAIELGQLLLALDPLREQSHRLLMRLHMAQGERSQALGQFRLCREVLQKELGVEPSPETLALAAKISAEQGEALPAGEASLPATSYNLSIAVLPFAHGGDDPDQQFLAEGLAEDIIMELSRQKDFLVIARQSSFLFESDARVAATAAEKLGVRYVLTGTVRRGGENLRIAVQLIDAAGNRCVWAERYDRKVHEIFAVQDEIVNEIIGTLDAQVRLAERERAARKAPHNLDAWELFHRGLWHVYHFTAADTALAEGLFNKAIAASPEFCLPHAGLAYAAFIRVTWHFNDNVPELLATGLRHAQRAVEIDGTNPFAQVVLGRLLVLAGQVDRALDHLRLARDLNPSFAQAYFGLGQALFWAGRPQDALPHVDQALRLSPRDPLASMFLTLKSFCYFWLEDFVKAEASARQAMQFQSRENWSRLALAVALHELGRLDEARGVIAEARKHNLKLTLSSFDAIVGHTPQKIRDRVYAALRASGLS